MYTFVPLAGKPKGNTNSRASARSRHMINFRAKISPRALPSSVVVSTCVKGRGRSRCVRVLQCVAVCCSVLQCVKVSPRVLLSSAIVSTCAKGRGSSRCALVLQCVAVCCSVLQCVAA